MKNAQLVYFIYLRACACVNLYIFIFLKKQEWQLDRNFIYLFMMENEWLTQYGAVELRRSRAYVGEMCVCVCACVLIHAVKSATVRVQETLQTDPELRRNIDRKGRYGFSDPYTQKMLY